MSSQRIGLIGGLSWESTATYYKYFNQFVAEQLGPYQQPALIIDSLDFAEIVSLQQSGSWDRTGEILADSAQRLEKSGADVIGIGANTMHINFEDVANSVSVPVIDIRTAIANEVQARGYSKLALLGTKYVIEKEFFSQAIEKQGIAVIKPSLDETEELQRIIFSELTQGIISVESQNSLRNISQSCLNRGAEVVGLCCTEFGLLISENDELPIIDSTKAHVRSLLSAADYI